jgi:hypothetical protein
MTRRMLAYNIIGRSIVGAAVLIVVADHALTCMNRRQAALWARIKP